MQILSPRPQRLHHDFETYSDLDVRKVGASRYARHPSTEVIMCGYAFDNGPVKQWVPVEGEPRPAELEDAVADDRVLKYAWNKPFEWNIWRHVEGIETPHHAWRDPMVMAMALSFPGSLDKAGKAIGLDEKYLKKAKSGANLINWFCKLRPATKLKPLRRVQWHDKLDKWLEFLDYNRSDVIAERKIYRMLRRYDLPAHEWELWALDQEINEGGIPINVAMARNAVEMHGEIVARRLAEMKAITGLQNPNANAQLLGWLSDQGYPFNDLKKGHVRRALATYEERGGGNWSKEYARVLELRLEASRTAPKKFATLDRHTDEDGRLRYALQFAAAGRTWRWGGRAYQVHNLAKPEKWLEDIEWEMTPLGFQRVVGGTQIAAAEAVEKLDADCLEILYSRPMDVLAACTRPVIQAPPGYVFIDADLNAIENRVLGWLADDKRILRVFRKNRDPYVDFATYLYQQSYDSLWAEYKAGNKGKRTVAKPGVLGCGYMLGPGKQYEDRQTGEIEATGLLGYAWNMGVRLTPEEAERSVQVWRATYRDAVQFWWDISNAAFDCLRRKQRTTARHIAFERDGPFLRMVLPSDRSLFYYQPEILDWKMPWDDYKPSVTYMQLNDKHQWDRVSTHPGKLTENADQAVARDLLAHGIRLAWREGIGIVFHVHDQVVALVREAEADAKLRLLIDCMSERPRWAKGLPMAAAGHISKWFVKD